MKHPLIVRLSFLVVFTLVCACTAQATPRTYVFVHGAWMGAWCWSDVATQLRANGDEVIVVELPAHGADTGSIADATLDAYVARVATAITSAPRPVVLVGHSMGGIVITQVAEQMPTRIERLVYVGAFLPRDGETLFGLSMLDADSHLGTSIVVDQEHGIAHIPDASLDDVFIADGAADAKATLHAHYRDEPLLPFVTPVHTTPAGWGSVDISYVYTAQDHAVSYAAQQRMTQGLTLVSSAVLPTSHSPFLTQPMLLASTLTNL